MTNVDFCSRLDLIVSTSGTSPRYLAMIFVPRTSASAHIATARGPPLGEPSACRCWGRGGQPPVDKRMTRPVAALESAENSGGIVERERMVVSLNPLKVSPCDSPPIPPTCLPVVDRLLCRKCVPRHGRRAAHTTLNSRLGLSRASGDRYGSAVPVVLERATWSPSVWRV